MKSQTQGARTLVLQDRRVLLVRHTYIDGWYSIGGGVEEDETPLQAARRELEEEAGITVTGSMPLLGVYLNEKEGRTDRITVYTCTAFSQTASASPEVAALEWFGLEDLPPQTSPGTRRRIEEYLGRRPLDGIW